jgi:hypothetical protein
VKLIHTIALALLLVLVSALANRYGHYRLVNDHHDIGVYHKRGAWVYGARQPYRDVFSEYPQVSTWFFGVPHLLTRGWATVTGTPVLDVQPYRYVFTAFMALFLTATVRLTYALRRDSKWLSLLLLMPAGWYFTHNRFDIMPAFLTLLALDALRRQRHSLAFVVLGVATMTKWYALVMVPVFAVHLWQVHRQAVLPALAAYGGTIALIVAPTLLAVGVDGFMVPYRFHLDRTLNQENLLAMALWTGLLDWVSEPVLFKVFLVLQLGMIPLCLRARLDSWEQVLKWSALTVLCFMTFAKFYSPQWILWVSPMLILLVRRRWEIVGLVVLDLVTFVYFPLLFDEHRTWLNPVIAAKTVVIAAWLGYLLWRPEPAADTPETVPT